MKKTIFAIVVLVAIITIGILEQVYIYKTFEQLKSKALEIEEIIETDIEKAHEYTKELDKWWTKRNHLLESIVSHNETKEMTLRIAELEGYASIEDDKSSMATVTIIIELCNNLIHILGVSWDTIL